MREAARSSMTPMGIETKTFANGRVRGTTALWSAFLGLGDVLFWEGRVLWKVGRKGWQFSFGF